MAKKAPTNLELLRRIRGRPVRPQQTHRNPFREAKRNACRGPMRGQE